jgi:hypothetical protein
MLTLSPRLPRSPLSHKLGLVAINAEMTPEWREFEMVAEGMNADDDMNQRFVPLEHSGTNGLNEQYHPSADFALQYPGFPHER